MTTRGRFIAFESGDASGKSTQARLLAESRGAVLTLEPGGTAIGKRMREIFIDPGDYQLDDRAEALLLAADRAQHHAELIEPTLASGQDVVTDRYLYSSLAYQAHGRGLDLEEVRALSLFATRGLVPDVVVMLTVPPDVASQRLGGTRDRLEAAGDDFHQRVRDAYDHMAAEDPDRWIVLDGTGDIEAVHAKVVQAVNEHLQ